MRPILASTLMLSSIFLPAAAYCSTTADATAPTPEVRVSTGVTAPVLAEAVSVPMPAGISSAFIPGDSTLTLSFTVDSKGSAQNVKVTKSLTPYWDARVVEAIQKSHFKPGKLDDQAVPIDMNLIVSLMR